MKEEHPFAALIPIRAVQSDLESSIAQNGFTEPVVLYEGKIIEGRQRYHAALELGGTKHIASVQPTFRDWVLLDAGNDPLDWMVRHHVATHALSELDLIRLVATVLPHYWEQPGATYIRLNRATGLSQRKIRSIQWLAEAGKLDPVLRGEQNLMEAARAIGVVGETRAVALGKNYGAGDKFDEALQPAKRYLAAWKRKGYEFRHLNPKEAKRRLGLVDSLVAELQAARLDLEKRAVVATFTAPPERRKKM